jgi:hypothetical protein
MNVSIAIQICKGYGDAHGIDNFLDTLQYMMIQKNRNNLSIISEQAFDTVAAQSVEMLTPV